MGILLLGINRPGEAGLSHNELLYLKPMKTKTVAVYEGPGPKGGLRHVDIN